MRPTIKLTVVIVLAALSAACTVIPTGPSVTALPGSGKDFEQFRRDGADCREYAHQESGGQTANQAATESGVQSAAVGAVVGALAGAVLGGHNAVGTGAGVGLLFGSMAGVSTAQQSGYGTQRRYDAAYVQCMYAKGHKVPVSGRFVSSGSAAPAAPSYSAPPPPSGYPPPPPSGYPPPPPR